MRKHVIAAVALFAFLLAPLALRAQALADRVPGDAVVYVGWKGTDALQAQYANSHLKAVLDHSTLPDFLTNQLPALLDKLPIQDQDAQVIVKKVLAGSTALAHYPSALYLGPIAIPENGPPSVRLALLCEAGAAAADVEKVLKELCVSIGETPLPLTVQRFDKIVVLAVGPVTPELENAYSGKAAATALAGAKNFQAAMGQVQKDPALAVYVSAPALLQAVNLGMKVSGQDYEQWSAIRDALNLKAFTDLAFTAGFDGKDWTEQCFVGLSGPRTGVAALLDSPAVTDAMLQAVPQNATFCFAFQFDAAKLFREIAAAVAKADPEAKASFDEAIGQANEELGLNIEKDVLAALGTAWVGYAAPSVGGNGMMSLTVVNNPRDPAALAKSLAQLQKAANGVLEGNPMGPFGPKLSLQKTTLGGLEVYHFPLFIIDPAWAVQGKNAYVALYPHAVPAAARHVAGGGKSILDAEGFQAARRQLGVKAPATLQYVDLVRTAPDAYTTLAQLFTVLSTLGGEQVSASILPPLDKLLPELSPAIGATWTDEAGWHMKNMAPIPGTAMLSGQQAGMFTTTYPAMMMAVMLPSLGRARELSNRAHDAANLRGLCQASVVWANDNEDKMPDHPAQLILANQVSPKSLICKNSKTKPFEFTAEQLKKQADGTLKWQDIAADVDQHCDYIYLGKGTKNNTDASMILAYTKPGLFGREGINVAYYDCHVDWMRLPIRAEELESTNVQRKDLKLPPITIEMPAPKRRAGAATQVGP